MTEKEMMEKYALMEEEWDRLEALDPEDEEPYWDEPSWDLDEGFDPYEGCYTWDC